MVSAWMEVDRLATRFAGAWGDVGGGDHDGNGNYDRRDRETEMVRWTKVIASN